MRWLSGAMAGLFLFAAAVQWNDPDPLLWIVLYGLAAAISALGAAGRFWFGPSAAAAAVYASGFAWLAPSLVAADPEAFRSIAMQAPEHELPREALGLALCAIWSACLAFYARCAASDRFPRDGRRC